MAMTLEGPVGRVAGFLWGSIWTGVGVLLFPILTVRGGLLPGGLESLVVGLVPWVSGAASGALEIEAVLFGGAFMAFGFLYGLYNIGRAALVSDYSITFNSGSGGAHP